MGQISLNIWLVYLIFPVVMGIGSWIMKQFVKRFDHIEEQLPLKVTESQVRQLLEDKLGPIKEDIKEIKDKIDALIDKLI